MLEYVHLLTLLAESKMLHHWSLFYFEFVSYETPWKILLVPQSRARQSICISGDKLNYPTCTELWKQIITIRRKKQFVTLKRGTPISYVVGLFSSFSTSVNQTAHPHSTSSSFFRERFISPPPPLQNIGFKLGLIARFVLDCAANTTFCACPLLEIFKKKYLGGW